MQKMKKDAIGTECGGQNCKEILGEYTSKQLVCCKKFCCLSCWGSKNCPQCVSGAAAPASVLQTAAVADLIAQVGVMNSDAEVSMSGGEVADQFAQGDVIIFDAEVVSNGAGDNSANQFAETSTKMAGREVMAEIDEYNAG